MNGIHGRFGKTTVESLARLCLLLFIVSVGASADARSVTTASGASVPSAGIVIADTASDTVAGREVDGRPTRVAGNGRGRVQLPSFPATSGPLMADRVDDVALLTAMALEATPFGEGRSPMPPAAHDVRAVPSHPSYGLPLPEPDGWTAVAATIALALFFFLRRLS